MSSLGSTPASQEPLVVPAKGTPTVQPTTKVAMINDQVTPPVTSTVTPAVTPTVTPTVTTTTHAGVKNIVETAESDGRFTTLVAAIKAAELDATLSGAGPFTVFAPTDDAFKKLPTGKMDTLLEDPQGDLLQILLYHMVGEKVMAADLEELTSVETLQGGPLPISVSNGKGTVDGANVIITDIECSNGVIHMVDTVLVQQD